MGDALIVDVAAKKTARRALTDEEQAQREADFAAQADVPEPVDRVAQLQAQNADLADALAALSDFVLGGL